MREPTTIRAEKRVAEIRLLHEIADPADDNNDVVMRLTDGEERTATFFTLNNIASLMRGCAETGECLSGRYFWATDMVIVERLTPEIVHETLEAMVRNGEYDRILGRVPRESQSAFETKDGHAD